MASYSSLSPEHTAHLKSLVGEKRFSTGESQLDLHSKDQSGHEPSRPAAVIWPQTVEEVQAILSYAHQHRIPVTPWGAGTSLEGNPIPLYGGICLDLTLMNRILDIRVQDFQADVEPGVIYQDLNHKLRHQGLFFPPDPGARATIGGMIANNASGTRTVKYGSTRRHVLRLKAVLPGGEIIHMGTRSSKTSSAYDLKDLFVGSEGTLGVVVEATIRLVGIPGAFSAAVASFPTVEAASSAASDIIKAGLDPAALELMDTAIMEVIKKEAEVELAVTPTLFMEFHGSGEDQISEVLEMAQELCKDQGANNFVSALGLEERNRLWHARHKVGEVILRSHPERRPVDVDVAVPISAFPELIALSRQRVADSNLPGYIFGHAGDGNLHLVLMWRPGDQREENTVQAIHDALVAKALELGGTATGEHGVGLGKIRFMAREHGTSLEWMRRIKNLFDPHHILNPGKIFPD